MRIVKLAAGLVLVGGALAGCVTTTLNSRADVDSFVQQNMPQGSSRDSVMATLDAHGVGHSGRNLPNTLYATVRPYGSSLARRIFQVRFDFGIDDRLTKYEVLEKYSGP